MRSFRQGEVVRVPFPYTDREPRRHRPALVVSRGAVGERYGLLWVVMITSAANRGWPGDVPLGEDFAQAGLPVPSVVRPSKIATVEARHVDRIGELPGELWSEVESAVRSNLGFD